MYILGIDIGTSKIAGVLLSADEKQVHKVCAESNHADIPSLHSWEKRQDPERIVQTATQIIDKLKQAAGAIASIGISGQMHGFLYVDAEGQAIGPLYTWQDNRAAQPLNETLHGAASITVLEQIAQKTGQPICSGYALATHYYNCLNNLQPKGKYRIVSIGAYLGMRLCNVSKACVDPSEAASFGLYSVEKRDFQEIAALWGEKDFLPEQVPFYHQVGYDQDGIAVFQSLGDNQASFYGALHGLNEPRALLLNLGTGGQLSFLQDEPECPHGWECRPYPSLIRPDVNLLVGATMAGGKSLALLVDFFADILSFFGRPVAHKELYAVLNRLASGPEKSVESVQGKPLRVDPYFYGTRSNPDLRGKIEQIDADNLKAEPLIYAFVQAISGELKELLTSAANAGYFADFGGANSETMDTKGNGLRIIASGNAIRRNPLIRRMIERDFEAKLLISELQEEAACGAAWYAWEVLQKSQ